MKRPNVFSGVAFAFASGVLTLPLWWAFPPLIGTSASMRCLSVGLSLAYTLYLVRNRGNRVGVVSQLSLNVLIGAALMAVPLSASALIGSLAVLTSLNRALLFHRNVVSAATDGLVAVCGLSFASYLFLKAGSFPTAAWGFFLIQSVFAFIPSRLGTGAGSMDQEGGGAIVDPFIRSRRQAEAALERIIQTQ